MISPRIRLRPATEDDTDLIVTWRNKPQVMERFFFRVPFTRVSHLAWREKNVLTGKTEQFIIEAAPGCPIGLCNLQDIHGDTAEYGYLIGEDDMRGKGFGTEATRLMMAYAKEVKGLRHLTARVIADNAASLRSFEKAGFSRVKEAPETLHPSGDTVTAVHLKVDL